jgi:peptidyl-prolyl cis-trans isomerase B (cyclophilin B)
MYVARFFIPFHIKFAFMEIQTGTWFGVMVLVCWGLGCTDDPVEQASPIDEVPELAVDSAAVAAKSKILAYPPLTDANCAEFLSTWVNEHPNTQGQLIEVDTKFGRLTLELFDDVPLHAANFRYKISRGYYAPSEFVRVVPEFVVQGGNSEDTRAQEMRWLIGKHTLPSEFNDEYRHFRGALAMGRTYKGNPEKRSASYDFYIVVGRKVGSAELQQIEREKGIKYTEAQKQRYLTEGGTPHLDGEHTVFGRLVNGFDVLDRLSQVPTDESDWPLQRLEMQVSGVN